MYTNHFFIVSFSDHVDIHVFRSVVAGSEAQNQPNRAGMDGSQDGTKKCKKNGDINEPDSQKFKP